MKMKKFEKKIIMKFVLGQKNKNFRLVKNLPILLMVLLYCGLIDR